MGRWGIGGAIFFCVALQGCVLAHVPSSAMEEEEAPFPISYPQKKKPTKPGKHKQKRYKPKNRRYSAQRIEKMLENKEEGGVCNRLRCASNLQIAKSCLSTRVSRRKHRTCFQAFCAYGCNEQDYKNNPEVYDFCNRTCASKKYLER